MSKSEGNFITMQQAVDDYGADATRLACADARDGDLNFLDEVLLNELSRLVRQCQEGFSSMTYRGATRAGWYEMTNVKDEYRDLSNGDFHAVAIKEWLKIQCIIL